MIRRGCDLNWYQLLLDIVQFHESEFCASIQKIKETSGLKSGIGRLDGALLYMLVRWTKPLTLVETGTYCGLSAAYLIRAMKDNGTPAHLYTIDVHQTEDLSPLISHEDQSRYLTRITGDGLEVACGGALPAEIDFFFHDSVHRYEHQLAEFQAFWPRIRTGGILASHDVHKNASFSKFCADTYSHDERGYANDGTTHSFHGSFASSGFIQKRA